MTKEEMLSAIQILEEKNKKLKNDNAELVRTTGRLNIKVDSCTVQIAELEGKNGTLQKLVEERDREIAKIIELRAAVPSDCEQSELCYACIFGVEYSCFTRSFGPLGNLLAPSPHRFMVCKKEALKCKHFAQKATDVETN